jgi:hypothetical protein
VPPPCRVAPGQGSLANLSLTRSTSHTWRYQMFTSSRINMVIECAKCPKHPRSRLQNCFRRTWLPRQPRGQSFGLVSSAVGDPGAGGREGRGSPAPGAGIGPNCGRSQSGGQFVGQRPGPSRRGRSADGARPGHGLPTVVGVEHATRLIRDGQRVRVHERTGTSRSRVRRPLLGRGSGAIQPGEADRPCRSGPT